MLDSTRLNPSQKGDLMKILYVAVTALTFFAFSQNAFADAGHLGPAKEECNNMVMSGENGLDHGGQGHTDTAVGHFKKMTKAGEECLKHGQEALKTSDGGKEAMGHVKEALMHAGSAVKHGEAGHNDTMMEHGKEAVIHAKKGNDQVKGMK
jgi:hypothetical protein